MNSENGWLQIAGRWVRMPIYGVVGFLLSVSPDADANWHVSPEIGMGVERDDNTRLNDIPGLSESDTGYAIQALATFFYGAPITEFTITPRVISKKYNDNSELDSNDQFLRFNFSHDREKLDFRFRGDFSSESVRTAERSDVDFDIEDPEEIPADDTGRVFDTGKRDRFRLAPEFVYRLSQRTSLRVFGDYHDTSYDDDVSLILDGFTEFSIGALLNYGWSEKDIISIGGYSGRFEADESNFDATSNALVVGYNRRLSERTQFRTFIGSDSSEDENGEDQSNAVGEISIIHRYLATRIIASYRRQTSGSGSGGISLRDAFALNISRDISPRVTLRGGVRAYSTEALDNTNTSFVERDYVQIRAGARWNLSRTVSVDFDYRYESIDRGIPDNSAADGDSNRIGLWIFWHPSPLPK